MKKYFFRFDEEQQIDVGPGYSTGKGALVQGEKVQVALVHKSRGTGANAHTHPNEQFNYVVKGTLKAMVDGQEDMVGPGGLIYIPANAVHYTIATPEEDVIFLACKDMSWGIAGEPVDKDAGAFYGPNKDSESGHE